VTCVTNASEIGERRPSFRFSTRSPDSIAIIAFAPAYGDSFQGGSAAPASDATAPEEALIG